jgi:hypothetical protein
MSEKRQTLVHPVIDAAVIVLKLLILMKDPIAFDRRANRRCREYPTLRRQRGAVARGRTLKHASLCRHHNGPLPRHEDGVTSLG